MKKAISILILSLFVGVAAQAQEKKVKAKASPAAVATGKAGDTDITINYSQPGVKGRKIWGTLVPFGEVWRTGADEATTITFSKAVKIEGKELAAGKYSLFTIPTKGGEWTIIFNKISDQWGAYDYKAKEDALRVKVKSSKTKAIFERLTFVVTDGVVSLSWESLNVSFKVK
jgi:hypothetical protein